VGGSTANTLALLARFGHQSALVGAVGGDAAGRRCIGELAGHGVDVSGVITRPGRRTKRIRIEVSRSGERRFHISRGNVAAAPTWREVCALGVDAAGFDAYHSALATRASLELARRARVASYNGQRCHGRRAEIALHRELISASDVAVFPEAYLAAILGGRGERPFTAEILGEFEGPWLVAVTRGAAGVVARWRGRTITVPALRLEDFGQRLTDTTGAGDAFHAGLLHVLLGDGRPPAEWTAELVCEACRFGVQVAAFACSRYGTKNSLPAEEYGRVFVSGPAVTEADPRAVALCAAGMRRLMCGGEA